MKKTHKKIDNALRQSLTNVCDEALEKVVGFKWLTHITDYDDFPRSLKVICIFDSNQNQTLAEAQHKHDYMCDLINRALLKDNIKLPNVKGQVSFASEQRCDREERCDSQHAGNWAQRLG